MTATFHRARGTKQRGQSIVWFLATIAACCCVFGLVYNVGQVANKKEETTNAADAAALSGAMVEARVLNFEAYTNRALVANEVTIAQLVSIDSWVQYDYELTQWIANYTAIIPFVNSATSAAATAAQIAANVVNTVVAVAVPAVEAINTGLWAAREAANTAGALAANDMASGIAKANLTDFGGRYDEPGELFMNIPTLAENQRRWSGFTTPHSGNDRKDARDVILNSRDQFSTNREEGYLIDGINVLLKVAGLGINYFELDKTSGTTTLEDYDHWAAQDSLDLKYTSIQYCTIFHIPCGYGTVPIPVPLGYGRVDASRGGGTGKNLCKELNVTLGLSVPMPTLNCQLAEQNAKHISWSGLPQSFRDLADRRKADSPCSRNNGSDSNSITYLAAVQKKGAATLTTQKMGINSAVPGPQGSPHLQDNLQNGDHLTSLSAACVFFLRPDANANDRTLGNLARGDGIHEYASLYNPYWQARLTEPDSGWTSTLYALMGKPGLNLVTH